MFIIRRIYTIFITSIHSYSRPQTAANTSSSRIAANLDASCFAEYIFAVLNNAGFFVFYIICRYTGNGIGKLHGCLSQRFFGYASCSTVVIKYDVCFFRYC